MILLAERLFDGTGNEPLPKAGLYIEDDQILGVVRADEVDAIKGETVLKIGEGTILPGLIDPHVHLCFSASTDPVVQIHSDSDALMALRARENAYNALCSGITTVRDCGGRGFISGLVRDAITSGLTEGSRIISSGVPLTPTAGHLHFLGLEVDDPHELRKTVRWLHKNRVDFIKTCVTGGGMTVGSDPFAAQYTLEELQIIVGEAHRLKKKVAGHAHGSRAILDAVKAGFDTIEHCSWLEDGQVNYPDEAIDLMLAAGTTVCITVGAIDRSSEKAGIWFRTEQAREAAFKEMRDAGISVIVGSDAGVRNTPISDFYCSLEAYTRIMNVTPTEALITATKGHAQALGIDNLLGTLEPGKLADVIIVSGNPLENLSDLRNVEVVMKAGRVVYKN
jgi:imidazolonepropionase-like amidohydrolase